MNTTVGMILQYKSAAHLCLLLFICIEKYTIQFKFCFVSLYLMIFYLKISGVCL